MGHCEGFPGGSDSKESTCNAGDLGLNPGLGRSPRKRAWQAIPVFLLENPHGQRSLAGYSPWGQKESDTAKRLSTVQHRVTVKAIDNFSSRESVSYFKRF